MGDRGNIFIQEASDGDTRVGVFLYGHWSGYKMPLVLQAALKMKERWNDPQYFARIVFQQLVGNDDGATGFGISARIGDNEYPILIANCETQKVEMTKKGRGGESLKEIGPSWSFEDFTKLDLTEESAWDVLKKEAAAS